MDLRIFTVVFIFVNIFIFSLGFDQTESELTITIKPGAIECFFQSAKQNEVLEIEYQVLDSSYSEVDIGRDLHVNFYLYSPKERILIAEYKKTDGTHRHEVVETGDFKICFDNTLSSFATKTVYMEVYVDSEDEDDRWNDIDNIDNIDLPLDHYVNETMNQIKESINKVRDNMNLIHHYQAQRRANEARDRNLQEHNFSLVNLFSFGTIIVMLVVGTVQVIMVKSLFEEKSRLHRLFKLAS